MEHQRKASKADDRTPSSRSGAQRGLTYVLGILSGLPFIAFGVIWIGIAVHIVVRGQVGYGGKRPGWISVLMTRESDPKAFWKLVAFVVVLGVAFIYCGVRSACEFVKRQRVSDGEDEASE